MFSFFNWFTKSSSESSPVPPAPPSSTPPNVHILSDLEYRTIVDRLRYLENLVSDQATVKPPVQRIKQPQQVSQNPHQDALHKELSEKIRQIRINMGESHGFTYNDALNIYEVEKSVCLD